jgi:enoyl-CoA hydratase/carnithine racemase
MRTVCAEEATAIGLLDRVHEEPRETALALADSFARLHPAAAARVKAITGSACGLLDALEQERAGNAAWSGSVQGLSARA